MLVLYPGNNYGCRATQRIQVKAQSAGNGRSPFQGLQRRIGSSGTLPAGEPESGRPRCCASGQGRRPFPARRALRSTAFQLAASVIITWIEYQYLETLNTAAETPQNGRHVYLGVHVPSTGESEDLLTAC